MECIDGSNRDEQIMMRQQPGDGQLALQMAASSITHTVDGPEEGTNGKEETEKGKQKKKMRSVNNAQVHVKRA